MRILEKTKFISILLLIIVMQFVFISVPKAYAATTTVDLLTTANFAILAGSEVTDSPTSSITGDVGLSPAAGTNYAGLLPGQVTGTIYAVDATGPAGSAGNNPSKLTTAKNDLTTAYNDAASRSVTGTIATELGGQTLTDGVYNSASTTFQITSGSGALVLDGQGNADSVFIFLMNSGATGLTVGPGSTVSLINGASACNVFWKVTTATINTTAVFKGNILALTAITVANGANIQGRLLARNAEVTLINDTITKPSCTTTTTSLSSSSSSGGSSGVFFPVCPPLASTIVAPFVIESRRVSPTSIFFSWGPHSGTDLFNIQYGFEHGKWLYNTDVTGFSTTINDLPPNQPIWVQIAGRSDCRVGGYGVSKLIGGTGGTGSLGSPNTGSPLLPNAGIGPDENNIPWYNPAAVVGISALLILIQRKYRFLSKS